MKSISVLLILGFFINMTIYGEYVCRINPNSSLLKEEYFYDIADMPKKLEKEGLSAEDIDNILSITITELSITTLIPMKIVYFTEISTELVGVKFEDNEDLGIYVVGIEDISCGEEEGNSTPTNIKKSNVI